MTILVLPTQMSEDLVKQLSSYKAQLQQVEVALSTDPENEDLLKLQKDLQVRVCWRFYRYRCNESQFENIFYLHHRIFNVCLTVLVVGKLLINLMKS